jgi:predicted nucleotide-binding protein
VAPFLGDTRFPRRLIGFFLDLPDTPSTLTEPQMPLDKRYLFFSYAQEDLDRVRPLADAVRKELVRRAVPVELWMDLSNLRPGESWDAVIAEALQASIGFVFFVSPRSLQSQWVRRELEIAEGDSHRLIIPVLLHQSRDLPDLPTSLRLRQGLTFEGLQTREDIEEAAAQIVRATESYLRATPEPRAAVTKAEAPLIAADIAQEVRSSAEPAGVEGHPSSVFVVHGHETAALNRLEKYLGSVGVVPIILSRLEESPQSLFQKFMTIGAQAHFAIVLLCADDYGASRRQYEAPSVGDRALQFRARQNVILELGFFYGRLGWESVFVVYEEPAQVFPNFERPSDLDGVVFDSISDAGWQQKLGAKLTAAGFQLVQSA